MLLDTGCPARLESPVAAREEDRAHPFASPPRAPDPCGLPAARALTPEYDPHRDEGEVRAEPGRVAFAAPAAV